MNNLLKHLDISYDVLEAIDKDIPVIGMESATISHNIPYPKNLEMANACIDIIRGNGCVPATLAVIGGRIKVGLNEEDLEFMARGENIVQMSRRDLPIIVSKGLNGSTTVATSIIISRMMGIRMLVTPGIGGVHRNAQQTFDISRDLEELASSNICLVCSGPKAILDIGLTLEYLETKGVPVLGYKTDSMPAFFKSNSGYGLDYRFDDPVEIGKMVKTKWDIGLKGGVLVANPVANEYALDEKYLDEAIVESINKMDKENYRFKDITPILMEVLSQKSDGRIVTSIVESMKSNVKVGSLIAKELYRMDYNG